MTNGISTTVTRLLCEPCLEQGFDAKPATHAVNGLEDSRKRIGYTLVCEEHIGYAAAEFITA